MSSYVSIDNFPQMSKLGRMINAMPSPSAGLVPEWSISDRLRKAREAAGLDQTQLSDLTGVSRATISAAENGHTNPSNATVRLWAMATGVPLGWIEQGDSWCTPRDLNPEPTDSGSLIRGPWLQDLVGDAA